MPVYPGALRIARHPDGIGGKQLWSNFPDRDLNEAARAADATREARTEQLLVG
jgi:hypothetical protein